MFKIAPFSPLWPGKFSWESCELFLALFEIRIFLLFRWSARSGDPLRSLREILV